MSSRLDLLIFGRRKRREGKKAFGCLILQGGCVGRLVSCLLHAAWAG